LIPPSHRDLKEAKILLDRESRLLGQRQVLVQPGGVQSRHQDEGARRASLQHLRIVGLSLIKYTLHHHPKVADQSVFVGGRVESGP
jgi:hypothetical protein